MDDYCVKCGKRDRILEKMRERYELHKDDADPLTRAYPINENAICMCWEHKGKDGK